MTPQKEYQKLKEAENRTIFSLFFIKRSKNLTVTHPAPLLSNGVGSLELYLLEYQPHTNI
jgi:hypothetical protein